MAGGVSPSGLTNRDLRESERCQKSPISNLAVIAFGLVGRGWLVGPEVEDDKTCRMDLIGRETGMDDGRNGQSNCFDYESEWLAGWLAAEERKGEKDQKQGRGFTLQIGFVDSLKRVLKRCSRRDLWQRIC